MSNSSRSIQVEKRQLRERFKTYRASLSEKEYRRLSQDICRRAVSFQPIIDAGVVHAYWPMTHRHEIDSRELIGALREGGKSIVLPVVEVFEPAAQSRPRMSHVLWSPDEPLRPNRWGVHEPRAAEPVPLDRVDIVIVPALGADRHGFRIGHGHGYYDEFLAYIDALTVGLVYESCLLPDLPHEAHDVPLDVIITETRVWDSRRS